MRVVLDTNILISAFISRNGLPYQCLKYREDRYQLVTSTWQIEEIRDVASRAELRPLLKRAEVGTLINELRSKAVLLDKLPTVNYSPDPDDNNVIASAIAGEADYIVSGDKDDVVALDKVEGIKVLTAREFVGLFDKSFSR